jgi:hypothetical protein
MSTTSDSRRHSSEADEPSERSRDETRRLADDAEERIERRGEQPGRPQREAADQAKNVADPGPKEQAENVADAGPKEDAGAEKLQSSGDEALSGYAYSMATLMRRLAGGLRESDIDDFAKELSEYARRSPGVFLAGSVALGFGVTRFLKASSGRSDDLDQRYELDYEDYDYDYEEDYDFDTAFEPSPPPEVSRRGTDEPRPAETNDPGAPERGSAAPSSAGRSPTAGEGDGARQATEGEHSPAAAGMPSERAPGNGTATHGGNADG